MTDADRVRHLDLARPSGWRSVLAEAPTVAAAMAAGRLGPLRIWPAGGARLSPAAGPGWAAAGDAALSFDPLSSQGILQALRGGAFAGFACADMLAGDSAGAVRRLQSHVAATAAAYTGTHAETYGREDRWPKSPFWARRQAILAAVA
jgi:flavin-dependent dehydrogenase